VAIQDLILSKLKRGKSKNLDEVLSKYLRISMDLLSSDQGMVLELDKKSNSLIVTESIGFEDEFTKGYALDIRKLNDLRRVIFQGKPTIVKTKNGPFACAPLGKAQNVRRVIALRRPSPFTGFDMRIISVITAVSDFVLKNYRAHSELDAFRQGSIHTLLVLLEAKYPELRKHALRVMKLSKILARTIILPEDEIQAIKIASLLHDMEKIANDDNLGESSDDVPGIPDSLVDHLRIPEDVKLILRHQTERYDGTGDPSGLHRDEIPIGARILAITDAFDEGLMDGDSEKDILDDLSDEAGTRFDPLLVENLYAIRIAGVEEKSDVPAEDLADPGYSLEQPSLV
jgi:HD-GYP domain-containing protein (c-di-GMP phosphodiesterase class II)